ncbi:MAG: aspartate kinase [Epulopiscium sp. Nuni2H_MBin003]|nr:MAG: aspartate kinase [Epulopiscium sp. Nuni2H_MBin003]
MLIVQKFGGSSVANAERVLNVAKRIAKTYHQGNQVVVVLSAQGDTTDDLIAKAKEISKNPSKREMDMLLTTGEQQSVSLMAMALLEMGLPAISLNASQVKMHTTSDYSTARIKRIDSKRMKRELDRKNIVIVTGFQGINRYDDVTTLGRGGSDTTAVAIAAALNADKCEIYTDVEGVYTADPRIVPNARKMDEITYSEMLELASLGAKVLHNRSVELASKYNVELVVRSSLTEAEGTVVKEVIKMEEMLVSGVAGDDNVARVSLLGVPDKPGKAFDIFKTFGKKNINIDIIIQSVATDGKRNISFSIDKDSLNDVKEIVDQNIAKWGATGVEYDENLAKVSVVGAGMVSNAGVASKVFEAMYDANININIISTSEIKISILIEKEDMRKAMRKIHDKFDLGA